MNERVDDIGDYLVPQTVTTTSGLELTTDLIIQATGYIPDSQPVAPLGSHILNENGLIKVNSYLQLPDYPHLFCAGDVCNADTQKLAHFAEIQGRTCAYNVSRLIHEQTMNEYHAAEKYTALVA